MWRLGTAEGVWGKAHLCAYAILCMMLELCAGCGQMMSDHGIAKTTVTELVHHVVRAGKIEVRYEKGLRTQAQSIADQLSGMIGYVSETTGFEIQFRCIYVYLVRLRSNQEPISSDAFSNKRIEKAEVVVFVRPGRESFHEIVEDNVIYPYILLHELTEVSLIIGYGVPVDGPYGCLFRLKRGYTTRWFREGLSNYTGHLAVEYLQTTMPEIPLSVYMQHEYPFSSLQAVRGELFRWPQYKHGQVDRNILNYQAALGLFLFIEHKYGRESIKRMIDSLHAANTLTAKRLIKIVNGAISDDIERTVKEFCFPLLGISVARLSSELCSPMNVAGALEVMHVDTAGVGESVGIMAGDIITQVGDKSISTSLDFEQTILRQMDGDIVLTVIRNDQPKRIVLRE